MADDQLKQYNAKRDFKKTQEPSGQAPAGKKPSGGKKPIFVVQQHAATRLHWDFRLELDGVLKSWAVTNEPVSDPAVKRLAVRVEDHPLSYATFAGDIPQGQYGGGHVDIYDNGTWEPIDDPHAGLMAGKLSFHLSGTKLQGQWSLVRMGPASKRENWLLIKSKDEFAQGESVKDDTAKASPAKMKKMPAAKSKTAETPVPSAPSSPEARTKTSAYQYLPELALRVDAAPDGDDWLHEIKYDGYRALLHIADGKAQIITRNGLDWTHKFKNIAEMATQLKVKSAAIDGEIVVFKDDNTTDFSLLQQTLSGDIKKPFVFMAFDLLESNSTDLRGTALLERKAKLQKCLTATVSPVIQYSDHVVGRGLEFFKQAQTMQLEGIISKNVRSAYKGGRNGDWLKIKITQVNEFVIGGILRRSDDKSRVGAVLLGTFEDGKFVYAGKSGTGFPLPVSNELLRRAKPLVRTSSPFVTPIKPAPKNVEWLEPRIVGVIDYTELTADNMIRHGVFKGLREDKPATDVRAERITPVQEVAIPPASAKPQGKKTADAATTKFSGITISHPERVVFPELNLTKREVAAYYDKVADLIVPYLQDRPLSVMRCPDGLVKRCFMQRHVEGKSAAHVMQLPIKDDESGQAYFAVNDRQGLLSLVQFGVIEFHPWGSKTPNFNNPDVLVFDLDPDPKIDWPSIKEAAMLVRDRLAEIGLDSLPKTTGGKGIHIVAQLQPLYDWDVIKPFARHFAEALVRDYPTAFTTSSAKAERNGKIYIDYLRNDYASTAVAPFSLRARADAGYAMTLTWSKLKALKSRDDLTLPAMLAAKNPVDVWATENKQGQKISKAAFKKYS